MTKATLKDLKAINHVTEWIHKHESKIIIKPVGHWQDLVVRRVCDASYFATMPANLGEIILLANKNSNVVAPLFWKSKTISWVCTSSKDVETRALEKCLTDSLYSVNRIEQMLFSDNKK